VYIGVVFELCTKKKKEEDDQIRRTFERTTRYSRKADRECWIDESSTTLAPSKKTVRALTRARITTTKTEC